MTNIPFVIHNDVTATSVMTNNFSATFSRLGGYTTKVVNLTASAVSNGVDLTTADSGTTFVFSEQVQTGGSVQLPTPVGNPGLNYTFRSSIDIPFVNGPGFINIKDLDLMYGNILDLTAGSPNSINLNPSAPHNNITISPSVASGSMLIVIESDGSLYRVNAQVKQTIANTPFFFA